MSPEDYKSLIILISLTVAAVALTIAFLRYTSGNLSGDQLAAFSSLLIGLLVCGILELHDAHWLLVVAAWGLGAYGFQKCGRGARQSQAGGVNNAV